MWRAPLHSGQPAHQQPHRVLPDSSYTSAPSAVGSLLPRLGPVGFLTLGWTRLTSSSSPCDSLHVTGVLLQTCSACNHTKQYTLCISVFPNSNTCLQACRQHTRVTVAAQCDLQLWIQRAFHDMLFIGRLLELDIQAQSFHA